MALDLKTWLKELGVSDDAAATILPALESSAPKIEAWRDASTATQRAELAARQTELDQANERVVSELAEMAEMRAKGEPATAAQRQALENAQALSARLRTRLETFATEQGLDPKKVLEGLDAPIVKPDPPKPTGIQQTDLDNLRSETGRMGTFVASLAPELMDIADEHQTLFGQRLNRKQLTDEFLAQLPSKNPVRSLGDFYASKYPVAEKRSEAATAAHQAELAAAEARGYERRATEAAIPSAHPEGNSAPVFRRADGQTGPILKRPSVAGQLNRTQSAARSLEKHIKEFETAARGAAGR